MSSSTTRQLPAVRLPPALSPASDLQPSQKFELNWPQDPHLSPSTSRAAQLAAASQHAEHDGDGDGTVTGAGGAYPWHEAEQGNEPDSTPTSDPKDASGAHVPRLSRAFSMPLPSQLGHLKHPTRHSGSQRTTPPDPSAHDYKEISLELADSVQMVIQTLLQLAPPHLLDLAKEQFAACAVQIPTPSISALLTSMKNLNYMSAHMPELSSPEPSPTPSSSYLPSPLRQSVEAYSDFDIGEMLQNVGDALSGVAAQAGVDLVLYHADVGMKHISVTGDECGLSYALTHVRIRSEGFRIDANARFRLFAKC